MKMIMIMNAFFVILNVLLASELGSIVVVSVILITS